ncbi:reverse transcriptase domain-containing protein [Tanacetum coccineum]
MKKSIAELPMLTAPKEKEELIIYLAAAKEAICAVLMTERDENQMPIYFTSRALQGVHWKSKPKRQKSSIEDDLSQPWVCKETNPFTLQIRYFDFPKNMNASSLQDITREVKIPEISLLKIFQAAAKTRMLAMPT